MPILSRPPVIPINNDKHFEVLIERQTKMVKTMILQEIMILFQ